LKELRCIPSRQSHQVEEDDRSAQHNRGQVLEGNRDSLARVELRVVGAKLHDDKSCLAVAK
jgi:hypothetical protein